VTEEPDGHLQWFQAKYQWTAGEHAAFERVVEALLDRPPAWPMERRYIAWAMLWHGDPSQAADVFEEVDDGDSWLQSASPEVAFCRLAAGEVTAGEERLHSYLATLRSFEDLWDMVRFDLPVIHWRYGTGPGAAPITAAVTWLEQVARDRIA